MDRLIANGQNKVLTVSGNALKINWLYGYVTNGLVLCLDGIDKGDVSGYWTDLVGNHEFSNNYGAVFASDHVEFDGSATRLFNTSFTTPSTSTGTIEVVYERNEATSGIIYYPIVTSNDSTKRLAFGITSTGNLLWTSGSASPRYPVPMSASVSVSGNGCWANGVKQISNGSDYYTSSNTSYNRIGCRYSGGSNKTYFNGNVYCIRIYNRRLSEAEVMNNWWVDNQRFNLT